MRKKSLTFGISLVLALCLYAPAGPYKVVGHKGSFYFGHISYVDVRPGGSEPLVLREDKEAPETAILNLPLGPGDVIETPSSSRCEIQFDNGTIVRLDVGTKLKIETILAKSLSSSAKISNLLLAQGQVYVMHRRYDSLETFQVITPRAAVKLSDNAVAFIEMRDGEAAVQVERGRAEVLYGQDKDNVGQKKIEAGRRIVIDDEDVLQPAEHPAPSEFKTWNEGINAHFAKLHEGNVLPKPYQNLPPAVFDFAQKFGNPNGEWVWHDLYGYVWRPYLNDLHYPWGIWQADWQPYSYGNWQEYKGQLYWIPAELWGWVPYHLGLWMWDKKAGWVWMPGALFASAWVAWDFFADSFLWRPLSLFDFGGWLPGLYWETQGYGWNSASWLAGGGGASPSGVPVRNAITKDELKKPANPTMPLPKELRGPLQALRKAMDRHDEGVLASYRETLRQSVVVRKEDLGKAGWQERTVPLDRLLARQNAVGGNEAALRTGSSDSAAGRALRQIIAARTPAELQARMGSNSPAQRRTISRREFNFEGAGGGARPGASPVRAGEPAGRAIPGSNSGAGAAHGDRWVGQPGLRFRDWNPDVRVAVHLGVTIGYSTRTNEVFCPQLGLASGNRSRFERLSMASDGVDLAGPRSFNHGGSSGSSAGMSSSAIQSSGGQAAGSSGPRGSSKEGSGGKQ